MLTSEFMYQEENLGQVNLWCISLIFSSEYNIIVILHLVPHTDFLQLICKLYNYLMWSLVL